uniref:Putative secreted peptide n=1 Tax=Anopheles braziliensis TaxID=58242 RepID=A0A2M3ZWW3_9DIPT
MATHFIISYCIVLYFLLENVHFVRSKERTPRRRGKRIYDTRRTVHSTGERGLLLCVFSLRGTLDRIF